MSTLAKTVPNSSSWAAKIRAAWQSSINGIIECGQLLIAAKAELGHGEFEVMIENELPFTPSTARRLMIVAEDERIRAHVHVLPPSWGTLYELTKLDDNEFAAAITDRARPGAARHRPRCENEPALVLRARLPRPAPPICQTTSARRAVAPDSRTRPAR